MYGFLHSSLRKTMASVVSLTLVTSCMVKPQPMSDAERQQRLDETLSRIFAGQEAVSGPISLYEAQARALKYNLDARVKMFDTAVSNSDLTTANLSMLPHILANAGYSQRNNEAGSRSESLLTGTTSLDFSKSSEKYSYNNSLAMSWDFLDFGIGYLRAKQRSDQVLISEERRRAIVQGILRDVRIAYWKAAIAERMSKRIEHLLRNAEQALNNSSAGREQGLVSPLESLNYQKSLLVNINELRKLLSSLATAKLELASLINLKPGENFSVVSGNKQLYQLPDIKFKPNQLENYALINRPEIREQDYQHRIRQREIQQSWLKMFPSVSANLTYNHDRNKFLYNNSWLDLGFKVVFDVLAPITKMQEAANGKLQLQEEDAKRDALTVAILAQVNIAYAQHKIALDRISLVEKIARVNNDIYLNSQRQKMAGTYSDQKVIDDAVNSLFSDLQRDYAYADLQHSFGQLLSSMGMDVVPESVDSDSISTLASAIETHMNTVSVNSKISTAFRSNNLPELAFINPKLVDTSKDTQLAINTPAPALVSQHKEKLASNNDPRNNQMLIAESHQSLDHAPIQVASIIPTPVRKPKIPAVTTSRDAQVVEVKKPKNKQFKVELAQQSYMVSEPSDAADKAKNVKKQKSKKLKQVAPASHNSSKQKQEMSIAQEDDSQDNTVWIIELGTFTAAADADYQLYEVQQYIPGTIPAELMGVRREQKFGHATKYHPYLRFGKQTDAHKIVTIFNKNKVENTLLGSKK